VFAPGLTGPGDGRRCCGLVSRLGSIEKTCLCRVLCLVPCPNRVQTVSICRLPYIPVHRILSFSKKLFNRILSNRFISDCCFLLPFSPSAHYPPLSFQCIPSVHNNRKASHVGLCGPLISVPAHWVKTMILQTLVSTFHFFNHCDAWCKPN
jgi:hypothetical protein